jgi:hypothetical protein
LPDHLLSQVDLANSSVLSVHVIVIIKVRVDLSIYHLLDKLGFLGLAGDLLGDVVYDFFVLDYLSELDYTGFPHLQ